VICARSLARGLDTHSRNFDSAQRGLSKWLALRKDAVPPDNAAERAGMGGYSKPVPGFMSAEICR
jgi:hypothetical protein